MCCQGEGSHRPGISSCEAREGNTEAPRIEKAANYGGLIFQRRLISTRNTPVKPYAPTRSVQGLRRTTSSPEKLAIAVFSHCKQFDHGTPSTLEINKVESVYAFSEVDYSYRGLRSM